MAVFPRPREREIWPLLHVGGASALVSTLNRCGAMPVVEAREGEKIERGRAYVAPSDRHLLLTSPRRSKLADSAEAPARACTARQAPQVRPQ